MSKLDVCFLFVIISPLAHSESGEEEPIPELNDFDEAYTLFEYAKTTLNPLAYLPSISTTNKEIAEYLLLRGEWNEPEFFLKIPESIMLSLIHISEPTRPY